MKKEHMQVYFEEAEELLQNLESALIELEKNPFDMEYVGEAFRSLHTLKGSSGMYGFDKISEFSHDIENIFDKIRSGKIQISKEIIDLTLKSIDQIRLMLNNEEDTAGTSLLVIEFKKLSDSSKDTQQPFKDNKKTGPNNSVKQITYKIKFKPNEDFLFSGSNPLLILQELAELGEHIVVCHFDEVPPLKEVDPEKLYVYWDVVLTTKADVNEIKDVFIFVEDDCELEIKVIDEKGRLLKSKYYEKVKELLANKKEIKLEEIIDPNEKEEEKTEQKNIPNKKVNVKSSGRIKVDSEKLDTLVNLVGELVTVQSHLTQTAEKNNDPELVSIAEEVERLTWNLRDNVLNIRMIPIGTTFSQFNRLVRDLSRELGKKVKLETEGAETELDKNVIERLNDPLVHIIRNSIDHGIESPEIRRSKGKPETGEIFLSAEQSGANVIIKIKDDGAGISLESIKQKAVQKGLINPEDELSEKDVYRLIFSAGFSTAQKVTNVSGRGVGMDVVAKAIESLRGSIELESKPDTGTTIILKLPLTLAIIEGLLVKISNEYFVIPLSYVEECVELTEKDIENSNGKHLANVRGELVPYISLREKFEVNGSLPSIQQIVIVNENNTRTGFVVDEIIGEHQTVIKSFGRFIKHVDGLSGLTILGDGNLALLLDVSKLIKQVEMEEMNTYNNYAV
ncbi:MAG: chemotaxis protein CheA [Ignavibacteria bacterium]|jgi:two-component system chemotaxis sensor kinase CheA